MQGSDCWNCSCLTAENIVCPSSQTGDSGPLHAVNDCSNCSETTVRKRTQWKPVVFAVKRFAVYLRRWTDVKVEIVI